MFALSFVMLALSQAAAAAPAETEFTIELAVSPETAEGQRLVALKAVELCRGLYPRLGQYSFEGTQQISGVGASPARFQVRQKFTCTEEPPESGVEETVPAAWKPSAADEAQVRSLTERLFTLTDAGDAAAIHALWSRDNREMQPLADRTAALNRFREEAGKPLGQRIAKISWYVNPAGAPRAGVYAAVDYERRYSGLALSCGYVVWYRAAEGQYELVRQESGAVPRATGVDISPEQLVELRTAMRCPAP